MKKLSISEWKEFQIKLIAMPEISTPREILKEILGWFLNNSEIILDSPFSSYGLERYLGLEIDRYPVDISPMRGAEFEHFKKAIKRYSPREADSIARYLRDTLESLVVLEVDNQCARCEHWGRKAYKSVREERIVFECGQCGFASYADGSSATSDETTFASIADLKNAGLIYNNQ
jgi:hypothetical protein